MFTPELINDAIEALERAGYITVEVDANGDRRINAAPALVRLIDERTVTLADIGLRDVA